MRGETAKRLRKECFGVYVMLKPEIRAKKSFKNAFRNYKRAYNRGEF